MLLLGLSLLLLLLLLLLSPVLVLRPAPGPACSAGCARLSSRPPFTPPPMPPHISRPRSNAALTGAAAAGPGPALVRKLLFPELGEREEVPVLFARERRRGELGKRPARASAVVEDDDGEDEGKEDEHERLLAELDSESVCPPCPAPARRALMSTVEDGSLTSFRRLLARSLASHRIAGRTSYSPSS